MTWRKWLFAAALLAAPLPAPAQDMRASQLIGAAVLGREGRSIGNVTDLAIDLERRRVSHALVQANAGSGVREQIYGVPLAVLRPSSGGLTLDFAALRALQPSGEGGGLILATLLLDAGIADLVLRLESGEVMHAIVRTADGGQRASPLEVRPPAVELRGTIVERGRVATSTGVRQTARLRTADGRLVTLDLGPPGGEATLAPGESVVLAAHPGMLEGNRVLVVDVIMQRVPAAAGR